MNSRDSIPAKLIKRGLSVNKSMNPKIQGQTLLADKMFTKQMKDIMNHYQT